MQKEIYELLESGVCFITPTQRLSRHLRFQYAQYKVKQDQSAWQTPDCLPWSAWCKRTFAAVSQHASNKSVLLSKTQQQWLWQETISNSRHKSLLLQTAATARQAAFAYQTCKEWQIPVFPEEVYLSEDAFAFKEWVNAYEKQKQDKHFLDDADLPEFIADNVTQSKFVEGMIAFYGFDQLTTQQQYLIDVLKQADIEVIEIAGPELKSNVVVNDYSQQSDEVIAAACWAKQLIEKQPEATIGVISPKLNTVRDAVERAFQSVFSPGALLQSDSETSKAFSVSLGKPLSIYPMINTAMDLLSLGKRKVSINTLGNLLHSPFIKDANAEQSQRASFYAALRSVGEQHLSFKSLRWIYDERCNEHEQCESFMQLVKTFEIKFLSQAKKQSLRGWAIQFSEWLGLFGWPGERELNSNEYQTLKAWQSALTQLGSLDGLSKPVSYNTALYQLIRLVTETQFQPETPETPIQVLGITGAAAMQFDYLWVLNMQDDVWPELSPSNPFIPKKCQREYHVPTANAENQLLQAKQITDRLIHSSKEVVFSYITREGDRECRPSPLIKAYIKKQTDDYDSAYNDFKKAIFSTSSLETLIDTRAPVIPEGEIAHGGSGLFKDQAACPFKAFARHRLNAQSLQQVDIGLNAMERGNLAHRSLQFLWQRLKDYKTLDYKSAAELENMVESVVNEAINYQVAQQPETFTDRFTELERQRLQQLLIDWLSIERDRNEFKVIATEQWQTLVFQNIELHFRVDRIDELADGRHIIIDYKTGTVSKSDWQSDRPNDPQLPLYAITSDQKVAAIVYASLKRGKLGFVGLAEDEDTLPNVKPDKHIPWQEQLESWREILIQLANEFRSGEAIVEPTTTACRFCDLHSLCRIYERVETFDELEAEEGAYND